MWGLSLIWNKCNQCDYVQKSGEKSNKCNHCAHVGAELNLEQMGIKKRCTSMFPVIFCLTIQTLFLNKET